MPEDADLHADPALGVHVLESGGHPARAILELLRRAERAAGPQDGDQLDDLTGDGIPDEMTGAVLADQPLCGRLYGHRTGSGPQGQPYRARGASLERASVSFRPDAPSSWHPCVCHRLPSQIRV